MTDLNSASDRMEEIARYIANAEESIAKLETLFGEIKQKQAGKFDTMKSKYASNTLSARHKEILGKISEPFFEKNSEIENTIAKKFQEMDALFAKAQSLKASSAFLKDLAQYQKGIRDLEAIAVELSKNADDIEIKMQEGEKHFESLGNGSITEDGSGAVSKLFVFIPSEEGREVGV